jgi:hypothetical protein
MEKYVMLMKQDNLEKFIPYVTEIENELSNFVIMIISSIEFIDDDTFRLKVSEAPQFQYVSYFDGSYDGYYMQLFSNDQYVYFGDEATSFLYDTRYQEYKKSMYVSELNRGL